MARGQGVKKLGDLFEKYRKTLRAPQGFVITTFCEVVEEVIQYPIKTSAVRYSVYKKTLFISAPGPIATEIKLHKTELLGHLRARLGDVSAPTEIV